MYLSNGFPESYLEIISFFTFITKQFLMYVFRDASISYYNDSRIFFQNYLPNIKINLAGTSSGTSQRIFENVFPRQKLFQEFLQGRFSGMSEEIAPGFFKNYFLKNPFGNFDGYPNIFSLNFPHRSRKKCLGLQNFSSEFYQRFLAEFFKRLFQGFTQ